MFKKIVSKKDLSLYYNIVDDIYKNDSNFRNTELDMIKMLVQKKTCFFNHATITSYLIVNNNMVKGRFSLVYDKNMPDYVQIVFFEAKNNISNLKKELLLLCNKKFPNIKKVIIGLNCHLNYSVGFLKDNFNNPPLFGLPYTKKYYIDYFKGLEEHVMLTYRLRNKPFIIAINSGLFNKNINIKMRTMNKKRLKDDIKIYTNLNNDCFQNHPFWSDRTVSEDLELFKKFKFILNEENLLFAELNGKPVGFLLWYPDFNQLTTKNFGIKEFLKYKFNNNINTCRITEIAVLPEYRRKGIMQLLVKEYSKYVKYYNYKYTEGGFIFENNLESINFTKKMIFTGLNFFIKPYRKFSVFEGKLR